MYEYIYQILSKKNIKRYIYFKIPSTYQQCCIRQYDKLPYTSGTKCLNNYNIQKQNYNYC